MAGNQTAVLDVLVNLSLQKVKEQAKQIGKTIEKSVSLPKMKNPFKNLEIVGKTINTNLRSNANLQKQINSDIISGFKNRGSLIVNEAKKKEQSLITQLNLGRELNKQEEVRLNFLNKQSLASFKQTIAGFKQQAQEVNQKEKINTNLADPTKITPLLNQFHKLDSLGLNTNKTMAELRLRLSRLSPSLKGNQINSQLKEMIRNTKQFDFGFLSLMFAGQMLQRTFGGFVKSIAQGFNDLTQHQTAFGKVTNKLSANFSFLKFAIGNALNNPIILAAVNFFANALENLGNFFAKHPNIAAAILGVSVAIAAIGAGAVLASAGKQIGLMTGELSKLFKVLNPTNIKSIGTLITKFKALILLGWASFINSLKALRTVIIGIDIASLPLLLTFGAIIGIIAGLSAAYLLNKTHLKSLGLEVQGFVNNIISLGITAGAGLSNIGIIFITGIASTLVGAYAIIKGIFAGITQLAVQTWSAIKAGWDALWSGKNPFTAMKKNFNVEAIFKSSKDAFLSQAKNIKLIGDLSNKATTAVNKWDYSKQIKWAGAIKTGAKNLDKFNPKMTLAKTNATELNKSIKKLLDTNKILTKSLTKLTNKTNTYQKHTLNLKTSIDNLFASLNNLNGKTFSYTIRENRIGGSSHSSSFTTHR